MSFFTIAALLLSACAGETSPENRIAAIKASATPEDQGLYEAALQTSDFDICKKIKSPDFSTLCLNALNDKQLYEKSVQALNLAGCAKITDTGLQSDCIKNVTTKKTVAEKFQRQKDETAKLNEMYRSGGKVDCSKINDESVKSTCLYNTAISAGMSQEEACDLYAGNADKDICLQIAHQKLPPPD